MCIFFMILTGILTVIFVGYNFFWNTNYIIAYIRKDEAESLKSLGKGLDKFSILVLVGMIICVFLTDLFCDW